MSFGFGSAVDLELVIKATDMATSVLEGIGKTLESIVATSADFQTTLNQVQNNTVLTTAQMEQMQHSVLSMARESGAPLADLANAFMRATNLGFDMADATKVVQAGMESAVSTGSNVSDVVTTLALQMHEFGLQATDAGHAMDVLHLAAALGNATLGEFSTQTTKSTSMAANLGISMTQVDAALAALSRHESLTDANTQIAGLFSKLVNPAQQTITELQHLSDVTGVKGLVADFTAAGMAAKGFPAVLDDIKRATGGNVTEMLRLVPAMRGGLAEMLLLGTGSKDFAAILNELDQAMAGKITPTTEAYRRSLETFNTQVAIVQQDLLQFFIAIGTPIIDTLTPYFAKIGTWVNTHQKDVTDFGHSIGTAVGSGVQALATQISTHHVDIEAFVKTLGTDLVQGVQTLVTELPKLASDFDTMAKSVKGFATELGPVVDLMGKLLSINGTILRTQLDLAQQSATYVGQSFSVAGQAAGGLGDLLSKLNPFGYNYGSPPASSKQASTLPFGPPIPPGYGLIEPGRFGGAPFLPGLPASDLGGSSTNPTAVLDAWFRAHPGAVIEPGVDGRAAPSRNRNPYAGLGADAPGYLDAQQAAAAAAAALKKAEADLRNAQAQFGIDFLEKAPQVKLLSDINAILKDMSIPIMGNTPTEVEYAHQQLLAQIAWHTGNTAAVVGNWRTFAPFQQAGEGQTIAAYGLPATQTTAARTIAALERMVAQQEAKLRQDEQTISLLQQQLSQEGATARNTAGMATSLERIAREVGRPIQQADPRTAKGLVTVGRG